MILQILNQAHRNNLMVEWQKKHEWGTHQELGPVRDGVGQRLGVWGYGAIGRQSMFSSTAHDVLHVKTSSY